MTLLLKFFNDFKREHSWKKKLIENSIIYHIAILLVMITIVLYLHLGFIQTSGSLHFTNVKNYVWSVILNTYSKLHWMHDLHNVTYLQLQNTKSKQTLESHKLKTFLQTLSSQISSLCSSSCRFTCFEKCGVLWNQIFQTSNCLQKDIKINFNINMTYRNVTSYLQLSLS